VSAISYDPTRFEVRQNPYPYYEELRRKAPVARIESTGFYAVARHRDVLEVFRNPEVFSSRAMRYVRTGGRPPSSPLEGTNMTPEQAAQFAAALPFSPLELVMARSVIYAEPAEHHGLRAIVNRGFTPRKIAELEPRIREIARECLVKARTKGELDLMTELAIPLPVTVIAEMLGIDVERQADFKRWSDAIIATSTGGPATGQRAPEMLELFQYLAQVIEARRRAPREDLISTLLRAEQGETLKPAEVVIFTLLLLVAGNETTTNLLGNALLALTENPEQLARVQADRSLVPVLVEEALRWDSPAQALFRETTQDTELGGVAIPANSVVVPLIGSANRDEDAFPGGDRFEVRRDRPPHIAFGFGLHYCLGASLARLEARVALEELLELRGIERKSDAEPERLDSFMVRGPRSLPLTFEG
jgi:cytochrome P450